MKQLKFSLFLLTLMSALVFTQCTKDNEEDLFGDTQECGDLSAVSLSKDIVPILQNACFSCHSSDTQTAGIDLENYDRLSVVANDGRLLGAVRHDMGFASMPPSGGMLSDCDIERIEKWIDQGALDN